MQPYVLVVEDEDALSTLLEYNFQKEGYDVGLAMDGEEALVMAAERTCWKMLSVKAISKSIRKLSVLNAARHRSTLGQPNFVSSTTSCATPDVSSLGNSSLTPFGDGMYMSKRAPSMSISDA